MAEGGDVSSGRPTIGMTSEESEDVEERSSPRSPVIYEVVRRHGEEEMVRPAVSLWWSGFAAGVSISFSLLSQALLTEHLPDAPWRPLIASFGYSVGFLIVVLARQQLFTENTITIVLPVMARPRWESVGRLARVWGIVLAANLTGTFFAAVFCTVTPVVDQELRNAMLEISRHMMENDWPQMFFKGIASGFLIATMVWLIPSFGGSQFHVITLMTWLIAVGEYTHIVAGSMEAFLLVMTGELALWRMLVDFTVPVLLGNVIGGTALFALITYAQVMKELES